jgi:hypothetical protein
MAIRRLGVAASLGVLCTAVGATGASAALTIEILSSHPQLVTNDSALVAIKGSTGNPQVVTLSDNRNVSHLFSVDPNNPDQWIGLVVGFIEGKNTLRARAGGEVALLTIINHWANVPTFAGAAQYPFVCEHQALGLKAAVTARLDPRSADCAGPTFYTYLYKTKGGEWKDFDVQNRPGDIATAKIDGADVPLIVRQEKGVLNRSGYVINILHDPQAGPVPTFLSKGGSAWNGKLVYSFGPGARAGYHQGRGFGGLNANLKFVEETQVGAMDAWITRGYAVASGSLNAFGTTTDDVVSAETAYRIKEQFIKEFGLPIYTLGAGVSGGSMQQQMIANAYPGILDGIIPHQQFADAMTFSQPLFDCELLANVFKTGTWTREQQNAVSGMYWGYCVSNGARYPAQRTDNCDQVVLDAVSKDPVLKTQGVRCTYQDNMVRVFGIDPKTGFARSPWDNVGIQYGLKALNDGVITMEQFIDINTRIGGHDATGKIVAQREVGDPEALRAAYESGRINLETGGLRAIPQVATRAYIDGDPFGRGDANVDVHDKFHTIVVQERLKKALGTDGTMVYLEAANAPGNYNTTTPGSTLNTAYLEALTGIDKWIMAIKNDKSNRGATEKVVANKPADLVNACFTYSGQAFIQDPKGAKVEKIADQARCNALFPASTHPRVAAGGPLADDIFKCQLKPVTASDYKVAPTAAQMTALQAAFPQGVCDWSKPGVGQTGKIVTWAVFKDYGDFVGL